MKSKSSSGSSKARSHRATRIVHHKLPVCSTTGLVRYRDRRQARDGAAQRNWPLAPLADARSVRWTTFACKECGGFHLDYLPFGGLPTDPTPRLQVDSSTGARGRFVVVDLENLLGGKGSRADAKALWRALCLQVPAIGPSDHVVIGANRKVAKKYSPVICAPNIKWVLGHTGHDGADEALLAVINPRMIAKHHDELVIMSGDHAFTDVVLAARRLGIRTHVVSTKSGPNSTALARSLRNAADRRTTLRLYPTSVHTFQAPAA